MTVRSSHDLLSLQPDLSQRYRLLASVLSELRPPGGARLRLLDLGAGPQSYLRDVAPDWFDVQRADVEQYGDPQMAVIVPGMALPFENGRFDVVVALEVLEHVPSGDRPLFIHECLRVAARVVILSTPLGSDATRRMEGVFRAQASALTGAPLVFLEEHAQCGLPDPALTAAALGRSGAHVVTIDNAPLAEWLVANLVDLIYTAQFGNGEEKAACNVEQNRHLPLQRVDTAHYRRVYCACRSADDAVALRALADRSAGEAPPLTPEDLGEYVGFRLVALTQAMQAREAGRLATKEQRIQQLITHMEGESEALRHLKDGLLQKDSHIHKLEAVLSAHQHELQALQSARVLEEQMRAELDRIREELAVLQATHAAEAERHRSETTARDRELTSAREVEEELRIGIESVRRELDTRKDIEDQLRAEVESVRRNLATAERAVADEAHRRLMSDAENMRLRTALHAAHEVASQIRASRIWRLTAPLRGLVTAWRKVTLHVAVQHQRLQRRRRNDATWPIDLSRRVIEASRLFDRAWYVNAYPDVAADGIDPLAHYLSSGAAEGRRPNPLFDTRYYVSRYPDVARSGMNPLLHYIQHGGQEGRWPNPMFDSAYYRTTYPDVAASRLSPLEHYRRFGSAEGRRPSAEFDPSFYLEANSDVRDTGLDPLEHYLDAGSVEGRLPRRMSEGGVADTRTAAPSAGYVPPPGLLPWFSPLNVALAAELAGVPRLNVLLPTLSMRHMSGGPNTVLAFAARLARHGVSIRLVSTDVPIDADSAPFWAHVANLAGADLPAGLELVDAHDRSRAWTIGEHDIFLATAWWTAQQAKYAMRLTRLPSFLYFIQDYEPLLHAASTPQALAEETYGLDYVPIVNTQLLADFLAERRIGRFADPEFARRAIVFEPALDRTLFYPETSRQKDRRRLLFYARPSNGLRNLFEMGVAALQQAVAEGVFHADGWEFVGMGEPFPAVDLGAGAVLHAAPWLGLEGYAEQMRRSDILLSLMLSPHPSYPPLEMAACGGTAVTTIFGNKDQQRLAAISPHLIGAPATIEGLVAGLARAVARTDRHATEFEGVRLPGAWDEAFAPALLQAAAACHELMGVPLRTPPRTALTPDLRVPFPSYAWPREPYDVQRLEALRRRAREYQCPQHPALFSVITPVWNTDPTFLDELCASVLGQDCGDVFEWVIVDNASTSDETRHVLAQWAEDPRLRLIRAPENLGIIGGLRACLLEARGRYVVPVDHDDLITPDCLRVLGHALAAHGYPAVAYSDEDKLDVDGTHLRDPYFKPDWDPVLFAHSCYTSHAGAIDRERALALDAYTDPETEGSHDWDTFVRFFGAGVTPLHVPEVLYTWRMHAGSTAGNIHAKPYVFDSQRRVLEKFVVAARPSLPCEVVHSPLFPGTPDWRFLVDGPVRVLSVVIGSADAPLPRILIESALGHHVCTGGNHAALERAAHEAIATGALLHLTVPGVQIDEPSWAREAQSLLALFPDTVVIGGALVQAGRLLDAGRHLGIGRGLDSLDVGRYLHDPGYFAQAFKPHSVTAVPASHLVVSPSFLLDVLAQIPEAALREPAILGQWLGAAAARGGHRVVYSPFFRATAVATTWPASLAASDLGAVLALEDRMGSRALVSQHLSLSTHPSGTARDPDRETSPEAAPDLSVDSYSTWLQEDRHARRLTTPVVEACPTVGILTSVWAGTPAPLFRETAECVLGQTSPPDEWIVLRNGPVSTDVADVIAYAEASPFVRVLSIAENVGIIGAMQACLSAATADYVLPLDADDLLEADALEVLSRWAAASGADVVFSDEDLLVSGVPDHPFLRPEFDAILDAECAYVWHPCLFRRDRAVSLGVYSDKGAEYCHDWDTLRRMARDGASIVHVPHLLYHWRTHEASHSNRGQQQHPGSLASTRHVLEQTVASTAHPHHFRIREFPRDRGLREWYIERVPSDAPPVLLMQVEDDGGRESAYPENVRLDFPLIGHARAAHGEAFSSDVLHAIGDLPHDALVCFVSGAVSCVSSQGLWDAVKMFELHDTVTGVGGRVLDRSGVVVDGGGVFVDQGAIVDPFAGRAASDPGPYALALKSHRIDRPCDALFILRLGALQTALHSRRVDDSATLVSVIAAQQLASGSATAYVPLLEGTAQRWRASGGPRKSNAGVVRRMAAAAGHSGLLPNRHGLAALSRYYRRRRLS